MNLFIVLYLLKYFFVNYIEVFTNFLLIIMILLVYLLKLFLNIEFKNHCL